MLAEQIENILIIVADIDNAMRRHKCHDGMVACVHRGELYSRPPFGYDSKKVDKTHVITVNEQGKLLRLAFQWIANEASISQEEVRRRLKIRGLDISKQKLSQCLHNCFYCGLLEHKYLDGKVINGKQEPLISRGMFNKVQSILDDNNKDYQHSDVTPDFPLKQHVFCAKDKHALSGYTVKAKGINYYKCGVKGCKTNVSAKEMHKKYSEILNSLSIPAEIRPILEFVIRHKFEEKEGQDVESKAAIEKNIKTLETRLKNAKMRFVTDNCISESDYVEVKAELEGKIAEYKRELAKCSEYQSNLLDYTANVLEFASTIGSTWGKGDFAVCQQIQNLVFPNGVLWDGETRSYRTDGMNPFFAQIATIHNCIKGEDKKMTGNDCSLSVLVAGGGLEPPTSGL
ncbi:MAG: recombinase family protein [Bacteroidales bacterium]|nr:recombinase family protein [Candidatus Cacconaster merdequi]